MTPKNNGWVVIDKKGFIDWSRARNRRVNAIRCFLDAQLMCGNFNSFNWKRWHKEGYRCVRIQKSPRKGEVNEMRQMR